MTRIAALAIALTLAVPAAAQQADTPAEDGWSLMERGAGLLMEGLRNEMEPTLQEMADAFAGAEPLFRDLVGMMDDLTSYHAPEVLPNGDILIRRKTPAEIAADPSPDIEL
jgi:hypothetical protein